MRKSLLLQAVLITAFCFGARSPALADSGDRATGPGIVPQAGHTQEVRSILYSNSGDFIVTGAKDNKLKIWSNDGRLLRTMQVGGILWNVALSRGDDLIAVTLAGGGVELWSPLGKRVTSLPRLPVPIADQIAFSPDQSYLVACSRASKDDHCQVYAMDGTALARLDSPAKGQASIAGLAISPDGQLIYLAVHQSIYSFDRAGKLLGQFKVAEGFLGALALSPDGKRLATTTAFASPSLERNLAKGPVVTRIWDTQGRLISEFASHSSQSISFTRDGKWLVSGGVHDNRLLIYDVPSGQVRQLKIGDGEFDSPAHVAVSPDQRRIVTADRNFKPVNINTWRPDGSLIRPFGQSTAGVIKVDMDPVGRVIVTTSADNQVRYWSLDGRLLRRHAANYDYPSLLAVAPNGRYLVTGGTKITIWDGEGREITSMAVHGTGGRDAVFSPDGTRLLTAGADGFVNVISLVKGVESKRFKAHDGEAVTGLAVHPNGKYFATGSIWERFRIWDMEGKLLTSFEMPKGTKPPFSNNNAMAFTPDGKYLVTSTTRRDQEIRFFDLEGNLVHAIKTPNRDQSGALAVSPSGAWLAVGVNHQIGLWDLKTRTFARALNGHQGGIRSLRFTPDERHLVSASVDGTVRVWNVLNGQSYAMLSEGDQWVIYTDDGYFDASRYGGDLVAMVEGMRGYAVDQFALYFNRPDIIYQRVGIGADKMIDHFRGYYERRLGEAASQSSKPRPDLNAPALTVGSYRQDGKFVDLEATATDAAQELAAFQIYVNDVPLYPGRGKAASGRTAQLEERVELGEGRNRIEVSAVNKAGIESLRVPIYAQYGKRTPGDLYFVGLGVSNYKDPELNLRYAHKDVADLDAFLKKYQGGHFRTVHSLGLVDADASRGALAKISKFLAGATVDDTVVFLVSGHGGYDLGESATYYFLSHEARVDNLPKTAISYDELEGLLGGIKPRKKLLLLDTCESGEIDTRTMQAIKTISNEKGLSTRTRQRLARQQMAPARPYLYTRDRYIYNSLARRTGAIVFSASLANEPSLEVEQLQNGIFTEALMRVLALPAADTDKDGYLSIKELETAVKSVVSVATRNLQHPNIERENIYQDFRLPVMVK